MDRQNEGENNAVVFGVCEKITTLLKPLPPEVIEQVLATLVATHLSNYRKGTAEATKVLRRMLLMNMIQLITKLIVLLDHEHLKIKKVVN